MRLRAIAICAASAAAAAAGAAAICAPVAGARALRFSVTYAGSGTYRTVYHSQPSNPGGAPDHNSANDSSRQRWSLTFIRELQLSQCAPRTACVSPAELIGATGRSSIHATIDHVHIDGLYAFYDTTLRCQLDSATPAGAVLPATIDVANQPRHRRVLITALDPLEQALLLLPANCPNQADPLDGLYDNYLEPGFSFAPAYGADRWFRPATIAIPLRRLEHARRLRVHVHDTRAGTPPRGCALKHPAWEQCRTGGRWSGTITLKRIG